MTTINSDTHHWLVAQNNAKSMQNIRKIPTRLRSSSLSLSCSFKSSLYISLLITIGICQIFNLILNGCPRHKNFVEAANNNNNSAQASHHLTPDLHQELRNQLSFSDAMSNGASENFPGVSKDVAAFCSARPSLQIDMASMIVHVKRNASFNYKLYLFSEDYVFQTGQIVPRDDFRIHAFPVKAKRLREFWPSDVSTFEEAPNSLKPIGSEFFMYRKFFNPVAINPIVSSNNAKNIMSSSEKSERLQNNAESESNSGRQANGDSLETSSSQSEPVDLNGNNSSQQQRRRSTRSHKTNITSASSPMNPNENIQFDRDDQVSLVPVNPLQVLSSSASSAITGNAGNSVRSQEPVIVVNPSIMAAALRLRKQDAMSSDLVNENDDADDATATGKSASSAQRINSADIMSSSYRDTQTIIPVGSFSSFHVNITYFVRKDFGQLKPELIKVGINANSFKVSYVTLIKDLTRGPNNEHSSDDYQFLTHKLLSDSNTRITAISQIYHDWITRNFYTVVYIQRLHQLAHYEPGDLSPEESSQSSSQQQHQQQQQHGTISNDRLIFRGSSANLLGAVQLDYGVRASAFITDKNGLHYFLDFLSSSNKFYIAAVDWTEKPFKFIDSQRFPIKVTRTLLDNEELLLCPPAFCHSVSPVDELVAYGRLSLDEETQLATSILSGSHITNNMTANMSSSSQLDMDNVIKTVQLAAMNDLKVKLHLRDWIWQLEAAAASQQMASQSAFNGNSNRNLQKRNSSPFIIQHPKQQSSTNSTNLQSSPFLTFKPPTTTTAQNSEPKQVEPNSGDKMNQAGEQQVVLINKKPQQQHRLYSWRYKWAQRNDIKARNDIYGYPLTGNNIDAAFRVYNKLHLISANFLITINYAQVNETQITKKPISEEFQQLSSTIIDPISGVFYDRYANQVFFFKGDRYIGYDYATRKPIEDFLLNDNTKDGAPIALSSLPVVGILGRQHSVDGIYHDLSTDLVHIFEGMKFYSYDATEFKSGSFRSDANNNKLPPMRCINTHFLTGCHFDKAFPNPCRDSTINNEIGSTRNGKSFNSDRGRQQQQPANVEQQQQQQPPPQQPNRWPFVPSSPSDQFIGKQQEKVREIAKSKLVDILGKENSFNPIASQEISGYVGLPSEQSNGFTRVSPITAEQQQQELDSSSSRRHEKALIYMLASLVLLTILATLAIVAMSIYSTSGNNNNSGSGSQAAAIRHLSNNTGKSSPASTILSAPYDSLAQLQASAIQAAYLQQQQHHLNQQAAGIAPSSPLSRYMATEPVYILDNAPIGLPLNPPSPNASYIRTGLDSMSAYENGLENNIRSTTPSGANGSLNRKAHFNKPKVPQSTNSLVVKGRRYDTNKRNDYTDNSVL